MPQDQRIILFKIYLLSIDDDYLLPSYIFIISAYIFTYTDTRTPESIPIKNILNKYFSSSHN